MEEAAFLAAVQGIVRRVHVQHDALRLLPVPVQEQVHQQVIQPCGVRHDLLVAFPGVQRRPRQLHPVQRALARRQSLPARPAPAPSRRPAQQRPQLALAQRIVIVQILVAQRQPQHARRHQHLHRMPRPLRLAVIPETGAQPAEQPRPLRQLPQQQSATI